MSWQLYTDSMRMLNDSFEANMLRILSMSKRHKQLERFNEEVTLYRYETIKWIQIVIQKQSVAPQISKGFEELLQELDEKLFRYKLHRLLKRKVCNLKQQQTDQQTLQLLNSSVHLIEKDLGIDDDHDDLTLSAVIQKSMLSLDETPLKKHNHDVSLNQSTMSLEIMLQGKVTQEIEQQHQITNEKIFQSQIQPQENVFQEYRKDVQPSEPPAILSNLALRELQPMNPQLSSETAAIHSFKKHHSLTQQFSQQAIQPQKQEPNKKSLIKPVNSSSSKPPQVKPPQAKPPQLHKSKSQSSGGAIPKVPQKRRKVIYTQKAREQALSNLLEETYDETHQVEPEK